MDIVDRDSLIAAAASGRRIKYLLFFQDKPMRPGDPLGAECLSQFYVRSFEVDGVRYPTAEHFMMSEKARLFGDHERLERILATPSPGAAKAHGRMVAGFRQAEWDAAREDIVYRGNLAKFRRNPDLRAFLLGAGERVLVEASARDAIWGIGLDKTHADAERPERWRGLNLLGFALMRVRAALREAERD